MAGRAPEPGGVQPGAARHPAAQHVPAVRQRLWPDRPLSGAACRLMNYRLFLRVISHDTYCCASHLAPALTRQVLANCSHARPSVEELWHPRRGTVCLRIAYF